MRMRAIVTGAAGFVGSHLVDRLLAEGHIVYAIDNLSVGRRGNLPPTGTRDFEFYQKDVNSLNDMAWLTSFGVDWFFHLAARADIVPSIESPEEYHRSNVSGTLSCLQLARKLKTEKFIYAASSSCYGIPDNTPTHETDQLRPAYPYALTKLMGEQYVQHWNKVYGLDTISLRFFNVYGPRSRTSGTYGAVFGVFLAQLANGKPLTIVGDGEQTRDFTYVSDVVDALMLAAKSDFCGVMNIGTGRPRSINELVKFLGAKTCAYMPERPGEPRITCADTAVANHVLGWAPQVPFEEGVKIMLEHLHEFKDAPVWDTRSIEEATKSWFKYLGG